LNTLMVVVRHPATYLTRYASHCHYRYA
jgi:hypothetical protein